MGRAHVDNSSGRPVRASSRIPSTLQAVILASNRGNVVNTPPPRQVAFKTFRGWLGRTFSSDSNNGKLYKAGVISEPVASKYVASEPLVKKNAISETVESKAVSIQKKKKVRRGPSILL